MALLAAKDSRDLEQIKFLLGHSSIQTTERQGFMHRDWQMMLDGKLATNILNAIRDEVGPRSPEQEKAVIGRR